MYQIWAQKPTLVRYTRSNSINFGERQSHKEVGSRQEKKLKPCMTKKWRDLRNHYRSSTMTMTTTTLTIVTKPLTDNNNGLRGYNRGGFVVNGETIEYEDDGRATTKKK